MQTSDSTHISYVKPLRYRVAFAQSECIKDHEDLLAPWKNFFLDFQLLSDLNIRDHDSTETSFVLLTTHAICPLHHFRHLCLRGPGRKDRAELIRPSYEKASVRRTD